MVKSIIEEPALADYKRRYRLNICMGTFSIVFGLYTSDGFHLGQGT